jgi:fumarate reductase subunit D
MQEGSVMTTLVTVAAVRAKEIPIAPTRDQSDESAWRTLYRAGGLAALGVVALVPIQMVVFVVWPPPTTVLGWFSRFQDNGLIGLLDMDLLMLADYILFALLFLALFVTLRRTSASIAAIAVTLELVAIATYFASTTAFEMLSASGQYAAASSDTERTIALAAGQVLLLTWQGTAFSASYVIAGMAQLLIAIAMLRGGPFGRITAYAGILAGVLTLVPPTIGTLGLILSLVSLLPMWAFLILAGRRLLLLSSDGKERDAVT